MKLSIAWIFDHIAADWHDINIDDLVNRFNETVAEIEGVEKVTVPVDQYLMARVVKTDADHTVVYAPELKKEFKLPARDNAIVGQWYLLKKNGKEYSWADIKPFCSERDGLLPAFYFTSDEQAAAWKEGVEKIDYILDIDNKSITNRPDLWGHRGVAREVAALFDLPFKPLRDIVAEKNIIAYDKASRADAKNPFAIDIATKNCKRFAGLYFNAIECAPSAWWMAHRLMRVGGRPIDALVDITNYVMFDTSQPLHAFDATAIPSQKIVVRQAKNKEKLLLLKDEELELTSEDMVVTDGKLPLALAGIRGGKDSGISPTTTRMFLESANFDATAIRKSALRHKIRTEASARFEKTLDPNQNILGITRFIRLLNELGISYTASDDIISVGPLAQNITIEVSHDFIESRIGVSIAQSFIEKTLRKLDFEITTHNGTYEIRVPTFRSSKDVRNKEDIVEEVARYFGYNNITPALPIREMTPFDMHGIETTRRIKQYFAYACDMQEVYTYALADEPFLHKLGWESTHAITITNPISEHWQRLVTTLVPNLLKVVHDNANKYDRLQFFEMARIWQDDPEPSEHKVFTTVWWQQRGSIDFYAGKKELQGLFDMLGISVSWVQVEKPEHPWYRPYQTACIMHEGTKIGIAGLSNPLVTQSVVPGELFIAELDAHFLTLYRKPIHIYQEPSKYPSVERDISMLVPVEVTVAQIQEAIARANKEIHSVELQDFFTKEEWEDQKSITMRFTITDREKTLTKQHVDTIFQEVVHELQKVGATIR